jgi:hypothetical protein
MSWQSTGNILLRSMPDTQTCHLQASGPPASDVPSLLSYKPSHTSLMYEVCVKNRVVVCVRRSPVFPSRSRLIALLPLVSTFQAKRAIAKKVLAGESSILRPRRNTPRNVESRTARAMLARGWFPPVAGVRGSAIPSLPVPQLGCRGRFSYIYPVDRWTGRPA